ncbi:unnamed protein product [Ilex paraguariensis]|uniref:Uncharacterized protein n=1 Tax=Ilex paraguariensis TaxID=185542 RepID=A0ABC8RHD3_9AQUA
MISRRAHFLGEVFNIQLIQCCILCQFIYFQVLHSMIIQFCHQFISCPSGQTQMMYMGSASCNYLTFKFSSHLSLLFHYFRCAVTFSWT